MPLRTAQGASWDEPPNGAVPPCLTLALLMLTDAIERLDVQILEVRHLQNNVIHALREPELYQFLRYEESFLWGEARLPGQCGGEPIVDSWLKLFRHKDIAPRMFGDLAKFWIPEFPTPTPTRCAEHEVVPESIPPEFIFASDGETLWEVSGQSGESYTYAVHHRCYVELKKLVGGGYWTDDYKLQYSLLLALQVLKRNILIDKLHLLFWADKALNPSVTRDDRYSDRRPRDRVAEFLIVRAGVLDNARRNVERLADMHGQFERVLDLGLQDRHRPITSRREEQGLYSNVLAERCNKLYESISDLFAVLDGCENGHEKGRRPIISHRWFHSFTSKNFSLPNLVDLYNSGSRRPGSRKGPGSKFAMHVIATSFWMPDRPDLQPVIAHECAHLLIVEKLGNLQNFAELSPLFGSVPSHLRRLSVDLMRLHQTYLPLRSVDKRFSGQYIVREILTDLLAASEAGPAYLYALCCEILGFGLREILESAGPDYVDISIAEDVFRRDWGSPVITAEWHHRLLIVCTWLEEITHGRKGLADLLIEGVRQICDTLLNYISDRQSKTDPEWGNYYRDYADDFIYWIRRSELVRLARRWRAKITRQDDAFAAHPQPGAQQHAVQAGRISDRVRITLVGDLARRKAERWRTTFGSVPDGETNAPALEEPCDVGQWFVRTYLFGASNGRVNVGRHDPRQPSWKGYMADVPLFRYLNDIPYECALLRAFDVLSGYGRNGSDALLQIFQDFAPGRETYLIAMEFVTSAYFTLRQHLRDVHWIIEHEIPRPFPDWLDEWLSSRFGEHRYTLEKLLEETGSDSSSQALYYKALLSLQNKISNLKSTELTPTLKELLSYVDSATEKYRGKRCLLETDLANGIFGLGAGLPNALIRKASRISMTEPRFPEGNLSFITAASQQSFRFAYGPPLGSRRKDEANGHLVLGRWDIFMFHQRGPMTRWPLPVLDPETGPSARKDEVRVRQPRWTGEKFIPFFERRELGIYVDLLPEQKRDDELREIAGFIFVRLERRRMRLDFLHHLRRELSKDTQPSCSTREVTKDAGAKASEGPWQSPTLAEVASSFRPGDHAYLLGGWADILIVLTGSAEERLSHVFDIQRAIFANILVTRTDMFLSAGAVDAALVDKHIRPAELAWPSPTQNAEVRRFCVSQTLRCSLDPNYALLKARLGELRRNGAVRVIRTPGRMDIELVYDTVKLGEFLKRRPAPEGDGGVHALSYLYQSFQGLPVENVITLVGEGASSNDIVADAPSD